MQMNSRGALCAPGCTTVSEDPEGTFHCGFFPSAWESACFVSMAPEHTGKVSGSGKPCMPAKTTRKTVCEQQPRWSRL